MGMPFTPKVGFGASAVALYFLPTPDSQCLKRYQAIELPRDPALGDADPNVRALRVFAAAPELFKCLEFLLGEAERANNVIRLNRDGQGQGRITVATVMHRMERETRAAIAAARGDA